MFNLFNIFLFQALVLVTMASMYVLTIQNALHIELVMPIVKLHRIVMTQLPILNVLTQPAPVILDFKSATI